MLVQEVLENIDFGYSVAENDAGLNNYFVVTDVFMDFINDRADVIFGEKGTGKSAIFKHLIKNKEKYQQLNGTEVLSAFNIAGESIFRDLCTETKLSEAEYINLWKIYIFSFVGNWIINKHSGLIIGNVSRLEILLNNIEMRLPSSSAALVFQNISKWLRLNAVPKKVSTELSVSPQGIPIAIPDIAFGCENQTGKSIFDRFSPSDAFTTLNSVLVEKKVTVWIVLDRLDESFIGQPEIERLALRALIRTYLDLKEFSNLRVKLFVRNDLFNKITRPIFVNLTHVVDRSIPITWNEKDLYNLLCQRIRDNSNVLRTIGINKSTNNDLLFSLFFPKNMAIIGNSNTWNWINTFLHDGNKIKTPRNLIDFINEAKIAQKHKESYTPRIINLESPFSNPLFEVSALKTAGIELSKKRVKDTLLAEYTDETKMMINMFRTKKSTYSEKALANLFHMEEQTALTLNIQYLLEIGFLEQTGKNYRVAKLYQAGLNITQGQAPEK
jgi:hypothetical protein